LTASLERLAGHASFNDASDAADDDFYYKKHEVNEDLVAGAMELSLTGQTAVETCRGLYWSKIDLFIVCFELLLSSANVMSVNILYLHLSMVKNVYIINNCKCNTN